VARRNQNRKSRGRPLNGWLVIDKPAGKTSAGVVAEVKRLTDAAKAGHGGTLDPLATGILPIALGEATKTVPYLMERSKGYRFVVRWGEARTTDDEEGDVTETSAARPSVEQIEAGLPNFIGEIEQLPPAYSAIKVGGQRAYDLARKGQPVELTPRLVQVNRFELTSCPDADHAEFEVDCGKGTYVRALARDLAVSLGTCGHVARMRRTWVGLFREETAISLDNLAELSHSAALFEAIRPVETVLDDIPALALTSQQADRLSSGQMVRVLNAADGIYCARSSERLVALAEAKDGEIRPLRVFHL
tara:strand:- start:562 stop:1473 length:912 start_codon:yes stop_codon:yes gene_type:complete